MEIYKNWANCSVAAGVNLRYWGFILHASVYAWSEVAIEVRLGPFYASVSADWYDYEEAPPYEKAPPIGTDGGYPECMP